MALNVGTDFKCVDKAGNPVGFCFGIGGPNHALFQKLQQKLNRFSTINGFAPLTVDGFIGESTVRALEAVLVAGNMIDGSPWTNETAARDAVEAITRLDELASEAVAAGNSLAPEGTPFTPSVSQMVSVGFPEQSAADIIAAALAPAPNTSKKLLPWILGGVAAVVAVGFGGYFYYRHKTVKQHANWGDDDFDGDDDDLDGDDDLGDEELQP